MSYLLALLGFVALIVLHEAGHFTAAKLVGMRVEKFSLFFGPMFVKKRIGETEYGIGPIPLGGYVKITGMNPNEPLAPPSSGPAREPRIYNQPVWKRVVVILAGPRGSTSRSRSSSSGRCSWPTANPCPASGSWR